MSNYNSYVGKLASSLESSNMQKHMGTMTDDMSPRHREILKKLIDYEYRGFISLIYNAALGNNQKYWDGELLKQFFVKNERDFLPIFLKMNEDCLNDPEFSKAIVNNELYAKNMGMEKADVLYYPPHHIGSVSNRVHMNLLYVPSASLEQPNRFRIDVKEFLEKDEGYPYINFSVDIGDDEGITYNQPLLVEQKKKDDNVIVTKIPSDMSLAHISFNEKGLEGLQEMFMYLFEKTGIKEDNKDKNR